MQTVVIALYRLLVRLRYGHDFRTRFGRRTVEDARALLADEVAADGIAGGVRVVGRVLRDLLRPLPPPIHDAAEVPRVAGPHRRSSAAGTATRLAQDLGFAVRSLRREPRFVALLAGVLGIAVGLNLLAFSIVRAYLLQPLPYPGGERLVAVSTWGSVSWTEADEVFDLGMSWDLDAFTIVGEGRPVFTEGAWITPDFLEAYDVRAALGRVFTSEETGPDGGSVAMISHRLWQEQFGGTPDAIGRTFRAYMSDRPEEAELFTIVGVLPADYWYLNRFTDLLVPLGTERAMYTARLRPGVSVEEAETFLVRLTEGRIHDAPPDFRVTVESLREQYVSGVRPTVVVLQTAVLLVLLIACANAAVLLLVRGTRREHELAVRRTLGAGGLRIGRQLVGEGLILAGIAGVAGIGLAWLTLEAFRDIVVERLGDTVPGGIENLTMDPSVLGAALALFVCIGIVFGLVQLLVGLRPLSSDRLRSSDRGGDTPARRRVRSVMVATEVALSLALLSAAGSMIRSALYLQHRDLGYRPERMVRTSLGLRAASYPTAEERHAFYDALASRTRTLPGVEAATIANAGPGTAVRETQTIEGEGAPAHGEAVVEEIGDGYFETLGIPLVRGRGFTIDDGPGSTPVAVVSESLAEMLWPGLDAIGQRIRPVARVWVEEPTDVEPFHRVVGVVGDVIQDVGGPEAGDLYVPYRQASPLWMSMLVRMRAGTQAPLAQVEEVVRSLDPEVPIYEVEDMEAVMRDLRAPTRFMAGLLGGFSGFALLLAIVGLYGVVAYSVRERKRDVAIRMALGADDRRVVGLFLVSGMAVVGAGVGAGTWGGVALTRALEGQLHGVAANDPATFVPIVAALAASALLAIWVPARAAARGHPMEVLKGE